MTTWTTLYGMTWLLLLEIILGMMPDAPRGVLLVHAAIGVGIIALAAANFRAVRATAVPGRVKRTAQATLQLSVVVAIAGALLVLDIGAAWTIALGVTVREIVLLVHVFIALAMFAQAAATGIAFDMWEEKEFARETAPGDVPAAPVTAKDTTHRRAPREPSA